MFPLAPIYVYKFDLAGFFMLFLLLYFFILEFRRHVESSGLPCKFLRFSELFLDISKIKMFDGQFFKRWQERVFSLLDIHAVAWALSEEKTNTNSDAWTHANKVCTHTILITLSNDLFDVYCSYKEAKEIWNSMIAKYTAEDAGKQKFVVGNLDRWRMEDNKDIKV